MQTSRIVVNNMLNHDDANKVLEAIEHVWGLGKVEVNLSRKEAILTYDERMASQMILSKLLKIMDLKLLFNNLKKGATNHESM